MNSLQISLRVNVDFTKLDTLTRKRKALNVQYEMQSVLRSDYFRLAFIGLLSSRNYQHGETSKWKYASEGEIYLHLMQGGEVLTPEKDNNIDIEVDDYYSFKRVIGYTYPNIKTQFVNSKYFDSRTSRLCGSNFLHEYGHKLGFGHDFRRTSRRADSLCYLLNEAYEAAHSIMYPSTNPNDKVLMCKRRWIFFKTCRWVQV